MAAPNHTHPLSKIVRRQSSVNYNGEPTIDLIFDCGHGVQFKPEDVPPDDVVELDCNTCRALGDTKPFGRKVER